VLLHDRPLRGVQRHAVDVQVARQFPLDLLLAHFVPKRPRDVVHVRREFLLHRSHVPEACLFLASALERGRWYKGVRRGERKCETFSDVAWERERLARGHGFKVPSHMEEIVELGYLTAANHLVTIDTLGWRTLFLAFRFDPGSGQLEHLGHTTTLDRGSLVTISVRLHRRGWAAPGEGFLRPTRATWYRGGGIDLFVGPKARSIRVPWWREFAKVHRPYFTTEELLGKAVKAAGAGRGAPCLVWVDRTTVRGSRRTGRTVSVDAIERKEFSDVIWGKLRAEIEFDSEADAIAFAEGLPADGPPNQLDAKIATDIRRSKWVVWTPKVVLAVFGGLAFFAFVIAGTIVVALEGRFEVAALGGLVDLVWGLWLFSRGFPMILRLRRREFVDFLEKWPRVLSERSGADYRAQSTKATAVLNAMGVLADPNVPDLAELDAFLRSLAPETFYGTFALQIGMFTIDHLVHMVGRDLEFWWEYLPDRRECAFRVDAAGLRIYPLTAVMTLWQRRDPEGLAPFIQLYAREIQMRLAFVDSLPAFVALGFTAPGWDAFDKFGPRVDGELAGRARTRTLQAKDRTLRERVLGYGSVEMVILESETGPDQPRFVPIAAFPFVSERPAVLPAPSEDELERRLEGPTPDFPPDRVVAWAAASASILGGDVEPSGTIEVCGVVKDDAKIGVQAERAALDLPIPSISIDEPIEEAVGVPLVSVRVRVADVREAENGFNGTRLWGLLLDFGGIRLPVLARRDAWPKAPAIGDILAGDVWLFARRPSRADS
jgi:hypothetical protein